jgi:hypothetical protein
MSNPIQTNELEAINMMLASIGERPVNNLDTSQRLDVIRAKATLNEINVLVQTRGWWFNEETEYVLSVDSDGEYNLPADAVKIDPSTRSIDYFTQRGSRLYNTKTKTYSGHTEDLKVNFVRLLPFDNLPESAKMYIARRAGVVYQTRSVGSPTLFEFTERDAQEAWGGLLIEELENVDTNLTFAPGIIDAVYRR